MEDFGDYEPLQDAPAGVVGGGGDTPPAGKEEVPEEIPGEGAEGGVVAEGNIADGAVSDATAPAENEVPTGGASPAAAAAATDPLADDVTSAAPVMEGVASPAPLAAEEGDESAPPAEDAASPAPPEVPAPMAEDADAEDAALRAAKSDIGDSGVGGEASPSDTTGTAAGTADGSSGAGEGVREDRLCKSRSQQQPQQKDPRTTPGNSKFVPTVKMHAPIRKQFTPTK
jgi:hypothetical protein